MKAPVENAEIMDEAPFRVSVNLERFFSDERARVFVSVYGGRRVRWLRRRLRRLLQLPRRVSLLLRGHLLPPDEPLALLRPDDTVHVIPSEIDWTDTKQCDTQTVETAVSDEEETAQLKKRKEYVEPIKNKMDISSNNIVDSNGLCDAIPFKVGDNCENIEDAPAPPSQEILNEVKRRALALLEEFETEPSANTSQEVPARRTRRRRVRRRARPQPELAPAGHNEPSAAAAVDQATDCHVPCPLTLPSATPIPASQDEIDSTPTTKQVCDSLELKLQPPAQFFFCGVDTTIPVVVRNNSVTPREARIVHPLN